MEKNIIHNIDFLNNTLPDKCANLIIADPPYYEVKGDFDFIWETFDDYLKDVEKWAIECKRILADNGTLFWYGDDKNIAYSQIIIDKYFKLTNNLIWYKYNLRGGMFGSTGGENVRSFPICTERILMYENEEAVNQCTLIHKEFFKSVYDKINETAKIEDFINCLLELKIASSKESAKVLATYKTGKHNSRFDFLSKQMYDFIGNWNYSFEELKFEYEELKNKYEELRRPFTNIFGLNEVLQFNTNTDKHEHDTVKPEKLTRALILTCSRENDLVVVPFAGSGTECAMSVKEKRNFVGFEITPKHTEMSNKRVQKILKEPTLF